MSGPAGLVRGCHRTPSLAGERPRPVTYDRRAGRPDVDIGQSAARAPVRRRRAAACAPRSFVKPARPSVRARPSVIAVGADTVSRCSQSGEQTAATERAARRRPRSSVFRETPTDRCGQPALSRRPKRQWLIGRRRLPADAVCTI